MASLLFTGDFCPIGRVTELVRLGRFNDIFNDFLGVLADNDLNITNLECPLVNKGRVIPKLGPGLKADEDSIAVLKFGGFNLVSLSNNHIMDYGLQGLDSTIRLCDENQIEHIGAGSDIEKASRIYYKLSGNTNHAFLNFSETEFSTASRGSAGSNPINPVKNFHQIREARNNADHVTVIVHGGHEGYCLPSPRMTELYRFYVDAGADLVVGHHPHCYSGYENYHNGLIFYSLGNFLFDWHKSTDSDWNYGYAVKILTGEERDSYEIHPYKQNGNETGIHLLSKQETEVFNTRLDKLNAIISSEDLLLESWQQYVSDQKDNYLICLENCTLGIYKQLRKRKILPSFLGMEQRMYLLQVLRCDSHRDLTVESLLKSIK